MGRLQIGVYKYINISETNCSTNVVHKYMYIIVLVIYYTFYFNTYIIFIKKDIEVVTEVMT